MEAEHVLVEGSFVFCLSDLHPVRPLARLLSPFEEGSVLGEVFDQECGAALLHHPEEGRGRAVAESFRSCLMGERGEEEGEEAQTMFVPPNLKQEYSSCLVRVLCVVLFSSFTLHLIFFFSPIGFLFVLKTEHAAKEEL